jgi:hypothetical protein
MLLGPVEREPHDPQQVEAPTASEAVTDWIRSRVAADDQMRAAAAQRAQSLGQIDTDDRAVDGGQDGPGDQDRQDEDDQDDVSGVLTRDHNQVNAWLKQAGWIPGVKDGGSPAHQASRKDLVDAVVAALSLHQKAEEQHLWPTVRDTLADGEARARTGLEQQREGSDLLNRLSRLSGDEEEFDDALEQLTTHFRVHVAFEDRVLGDLTAALSRGQLIEIAHRMKIARQQHQQED